MKVLLHICCGVCAGAVAERLMCEGNIVEGYFYNPNIHPNDEYERRLKSAQKVAGSIGFELHEGKYEREKWFEIVKGQEYEPEGGARCDTCIRMRLENTYKYMQYHMLDRFATTLSVSPHKNADAINRIGLSISEDRFMIADFKKKGGFQRSIEIAKELGLYRQEYCGCIYSAEEKIRKEENKQE